MSYIDNADITKRVGPDVAVQLTTDTGAVADTEVLDEVRDAAEGEVDGYLAKRYRVPVDLTAHPRTAGALKSFALDIAAFRLHVRRPPVSEDIRTARADAIKWLRDVAAGTIVLPATATPDSTTSDGPPPEWGGSPAITGRDNMLG